MVLIGKGAEAELYLEDNKIIKKRVCKSYRLKEIDDNLRRTRTKREAKIIERLPESIPHPSLFKIDDKNMNIELSYIKGKKVRDMIEDNLDICSEIGEKIAYMHNAGIIHGDLTTSNMIYSDNKVYFIDFGLSFFSEKTEDKAVDLHLLKQALESKHYKVFERAFESVMKGYKSKSKGYLEIKKRFDLVEQRGRNKAKF